MAIAIEGSRKDFCKALARAAPTNGISNEKMALLICMSSFTIYDLVCKYKSKFINSLGDHLTAAANVRSHHKTNIDLNIDFVKEGGDNQQVRLKLNRPIQLSKSKNVDRNLQVINDYFGNYNEYLNYAYLCLKPTKNFLTNVEMDDYYNWVPCPNPYYVNRKDTATGTILSNLFAQTCSDNYYVYLIFSLPEYYNLREMVDSYSLKG